MGRPPGVGVRPSSGGIRARKQKRNNEQEKGAPALLICVCVFRLTFFKFYWFEEKVNRHRFEELGLILITCQSIVRYNG